MKVNSKKETSPAFIATTPLQILVAMTVRDQLYPKHKPELILVNSFSDAKNIKNRILENDKSWKSVFLTKDKKEAILRCTGKQYTSIFIDSDVGLKQHALISFLRLLNRELKFHVYEEGIGTYRNDFYTHPKKKMLRILGAGTHFGGNRHTESIFVYSEKKYNENFDSKKAVKIKTPLTDYILSNYATIKSIFAPHGITLKKSEKSDSAIIYLTSWIWSEEHLRSLATENHTVVIKPHPHIKKIPDHFSSLPFNIIPASVPAELLSVMLLETFKTIFIHHHNSSIQNYINHPSIELKNLGSIIDFSEAT